MTAKDLNYYIDRRSENIIMKKFPGHTAEEIRFYCEHPLDKIRPEKVIIIAGTNDLSRGSSGGCGG